MKINFLCNYISGGWKPTDKRLGGTEESIVRWSEELIKRGHTVTIYDNDNRDDYRGGADICINIKSTDKPPLEPTLYLTNEVNADELDLSMYDGVIWPSLWAANNIPVNNSQIYILPHGYDDKKLSSLKHSIKQKQCLYTSSPDRGLDTLEKIWPAIVDAHPDAMLYVSYGGKIDAPNVVCGDFSEDELDELYRTSDIWLHPANGGELYCISGIKAQASGCIPVYFPIMALSETVRHGVKCRDARDMYFKLNALLDDEVTKSDIRHKLEQEHYPNWSDSTDILEDIIQKVLK